MTAISTKHPNLGGFATDLHLATLVNPPPAPPVIAPVFPWLVIIPPVGIGEILTGKTTILSVHTGTLHSDTLYGHNKGMMVPHVATWPIPPLETITVMLGSSTKHFLPSFGIQERPTWGILNATEAVTRSISLARGELPQNSSGGGSPIAISAPSGGIMVQQCQDANVPGVNVDPTDSTSFVLPTGFVFCMPTTRLVGFTWGDLIAGFVGLIGDAIVAALTSLIGPLLTKVAPISRIMEQQAGRLAAVLLRNLRITRELAANISTRIAQGIFGSLLGISLTLIQNMYGALPAELRSVTDQIWYYVPIVGMATLFSQLGDAVGNPPTTGGRQSNIWE